MRRLKILSADSDYTSSTSSGLSGHFRRIHMPNQFPCTECSYVSQTNKNLERHTMMVHRNKKEFKCMECENKAFNTRGELVSHVKGVHLNIRKTGASCNLCDLMLVDTRSLTYHMRSKHGIEDDSVKIFPCHQCEMVLCSNQSLKGHILAKHNEDITAVERFHCTICNKGFGSKQSLKYHMNSKIEHAKKAKDTIFVCTICEKTLSSKASLHVHMKGVHDNAKDYVCKMCDFATSTSSGLLSHTKNVHMPKKGEK